MDINALVSECYDGEFIWCLWQTHELLPASDKINSWSVGVCAGSGVIERWELLQAQSRSDQQADPQEPQQLTSDLDDITSWLENATPELDRLRLSDPATSIEDMESRAKELKVNF